MSRHINRALVEMLGLPANTVAATLRMRGHKPPVLTVQTHLINEGSIKTEIQKFTLVPINDIGGAENGGAGWAGLDQVQKP